MSNNNVGQVELDLLLNSKGFQSQLETAVNKAVSKTSGSISGTVGAAFGKMGKLAVAAFSTKAIVSFTQSSIALGSALQEVQNVVDSTFTEMGKDVDVFAAKAAKNYGLSETLAKQYAGTFGAMAKSFGFSEKEAFEMSTAITGLTGDVASFYNLPHEQAYTKLKSIFTGETESLKDLGVVMTQTALDEYAMANGWGKTTKKMTEQEKTALRYRFVLDKLKTASGDFIRTQDGWANQTRILNLQWQSLKANMGQAFIVVLTPVIKTINLLMEKLVEASEKFNTFIQSIFGQKEKDPQGMGEMANNAEQAEQNVNGTTNAIKKMKKSLLGIDQIHILDNGDKDVGSTGGGIGTGTKEDAPAKQTADAAAPNAITKAYEKATKAIKYLKDEAIQWLQLVAKGPGEFCVNVGTDVFNLLTKPFIDNKDKIKEQLDLSIEDLKFFNDQAQIIFDDVWTKLNEVYEAHGRPLMKSLTEGASELLGDILKDYNKYIRPTIDQIKREVGPLWEKYLKPAFDDVMDTLGLLMDKLTIVWDNFLKPFYKWMIEIFFIKLKIQFDALWIVVKNGIETFSEIVSHISTILNGLINFIEGVFTGNWRQAWQGVRDVFEGVFYGIGSIMKGVVNTLIDFINKGIGAINKIRLPEWVPFVGGRSPNIGKIPRLAQGGYVRPNTPQLAIVGDNKREGEIISPESKMVSAAQKANEPLLQAIKMLCTLMAERDQSGKTIVIPVSIGNEELERFIIDTNNKNYVYNGGM